MLDNTKALADYADAILVARRAKNWLFLILLVTLIGELALFFLARYTTLFSSPAATTRPAFARGMAGLQYLVALAGFAGLFASAVLSIVLILLVKIMLTVRTLGVGRTTSAFIWSAVLTVLLFPWQAILAGPTISTAADPIAADFKIPGVIYTWTEFNHPQMGAKFGQSPSSTLSPEMKALRWARFAGFPAVAVIILLCVQAKSGKGVRSALGEDQPPADVVISQ